MASEIEKQVWAAAYGEAFVNTRKADSAMLLAYYAVKQLRDAVMKPGIAQEHEACRMAKEMMG